MVTITETSEIPGTTTIEVTAKDKVNKQVYTVHFEMLKEAFFDDFSYTDPEDLEKEEIGTYRKAPEEDRVIERGDGARTTLF